MILRLAKHVRNWYVVMVDVLPVPMNAAGISAWKEYLTPDLMRFSGIIKYSMGMELKMDTG